MEILHLYLLLINAIAYLLMLVDKIKAKRNAWRIRERTLILSAALGGSIGALLGMYTFRHKTKHLKFTLGVPAILILQLTLVLWFYFH